MATGTVEHIDRDREARKHLWKGLERLSPRRRIAFVGAMARITNRDGTETRVTSHSGTVSEAYYDLMLLAVNHGLDLYAACVHLENWLRGKG